MSYDTWEGECRSKDILPFMAIPEIPASDSAVQNMNGASRPITIDSDRPVSFGYNETNCDIDMRKGKLEWGKENYGRQIIQKTGSVR